LKKSTKIIIGVIVGLVIAGIVALILTNFFSATEVSYNQFFQDMTAKKVEELYIDAYKLTYVTEGGKFQVIFPSLYGASDWFTFVEQLAEAQEKAAIAAGGTFDGVYLPGVVSFTDPNATSIWSSILPIVGVVVLAIVFWLMMRSIAGGNAKTMNIGKTKAHMQNKPNVRFADVAGAEEEKEELKEVVDFLKAPRKFADLGAKIPSGVLLVGPPGTGKTLFAKAVAGEAGVPFFSVSGSDFVEMYVGVGASRVRDLFDLAKKNQPCIIFIDEIDAVGRRRGAGLGGGHDEREQTLNQILVQMDGFETNDGIIVMAATNRADILDPALLRPGRFDRQINVNLPDVKGREQILKVHARNKPMSPDVNFRTVARITAGFSGAELANLLNEAAILAVRKGKKLIGNIELYDGINKVLMGPQKKSRVVTESDKRCTAYHEAGHAVLACLCEHCDPVHEVSIIPRGRAAGYTMTRPETDDNDVSYNKLIDNICMSLGGRVAEELVIHDVTTGASADLQHVSDIARRMVTQWGMSDKLGLVAYDNDQPPFMGMEYGGHNHSSYSQATAATIDDEIRRLIASAHERATKLLKENRKIMDNMARVLVERETIYTEEVRMLMEGKDYKEVIAYMDSQDENARKNPFVKMTEEKPAEQPVQEPVETVPAETATPVEEGTDDKKAED